MDSLEDGFHAICQLDEVPEGEARMFFVASRRIAVFRWQGNYHAMDDACPHAGASLARGLVADGVVACRIHHWRFRLCDGCYVDEERPELNATVYPVRVRDGRLEVCLSGSPEP